MPELRGMPDVVGLELERAREILEQSGVKFELTWTRPPEPMGEPVGCRVVAQRVRPPAAAPCELVVAEEFKVPPASGRRVAPVRSRSKPTESKAL